MGDIIAVLGLILFVVGVVISLPPMLALGYGEVCGWKDGPFKDMIEKNYMTEEYYHDCIQQALKEERLGVLLAIAGTFVGIIGVVLK